MPVEDRDAVFRQVALARLSVPDELTEVLRITRPTDWLIACALGLLLAAGLSWAALVNLEVTVPARVVVAQRNDAHEATLLVTDSRAGQLRPGLTVRLIRPPAPGRTRGLMEGTVLRVRAVSAAEARIDVALRPEHSADPLPAPVKGHIVLRRERPIEALLPWLGVSREGL